MGHKFVNSQLLADEWAKRGYFVVMPDLFQGDVIQFNDIQTIDFPKWYSGGYNEKNIPHTPEVVDPIVRDVIRELKEKYGVKVRSAIPIQRRQLSSHRLIIS